MRKILLISLFLSLNLWATFKPIDFMPDHYKTKKYMSVEILDSVEFTDETFKKYDITEISGLSYRIADHTLYAISDNGFLYHLDFEISKGKIAILDVRNVFKLRDFDGKKFKKKKRDAEGLIHNNEGVIVSFERDPRVTLFSFDGKAKKSYEINRDLRDIKNYQTKNRALESLVLHPKFGMLTAPETPLKHERSEIHTIYSKSKTWKFDGDGSITGMELMDDDSLLVMERAFNGVTLQRIVTLKKVFLDRCNQHNKCYSRKVAEFNSDDGWHVDNFEGLTKIVGDYFIMISDDNDSLFQKCMVVLFKVDETQE